VAHAEAQHEAYLACGPRGVDPALALSVFGAVASTNLAMQLGAHGLNVANAKSCASGAVAIGEAFRLIRVGGADLVVAGGADAPLTFGSFSLIRALSERNDQLALASRPFDRAETGALAALFAERARPRADEPLMLATRGAHGHALGATPAMETALLALSLFHGRAPPAP